MTRGCCASQVANVEGIICDFRGDGKRIAHRFPPPLGHIVVLKNYMCTDGEPDFGQLQQQPN